MHMVECEQSGVKQETALSEEEETASSVSRGASAAGKDESSCEQHAEHQQSENTEVVSMTAVREEKKDNEELNNPFAAGDDNEEAAGGDDLVQPTNDANGDDGYGNPVMPEPSIPTSKVARSKKRSCEAASSIERRGPRNGRAQTGSKKRVKLPHSALHETLEAAVTTAQTSGLSRLSTSAVTKARKGTFEGTRAGIEAEEEADGDFMPVDEEDGAPLDDGDGDHDEDANKSIVANCAQQGQSSEITTFDKHFTDLIVFKQKFGHCNVQQRQSGEYQSLGKWCNALRSSYKKIRKRERPRIKLTKEQILQLEDAGFKWCLLSTSRTFEERYGDLMKYKEKFGHCDVPQTKSYGHQSLGIWCKDVRLSYKKIQKGQTPSHKLTQENMQQLDDAGFKWSVTTTPYTRKSFDERYAELVKFKEKVGHCDVPQKRTGEYQSLGGWCSKLRTSYKKIQKREIPNIKLTPETMQQLDDLGFKWDLRT